MPVMALVTGDRNCVLDPQLIVNSAVTAANKMVRKRAKFPKSVIEPGDSERLIDFDVLKCEARREFVLIENPRTADEVQVIKKHRMESQKTHWNYEPLKRKLRKILRSSRARRGTGNKAIRESGACRLNIHSADLHKLWFYAALEEEKRCQPSQRCLKASQIKISGSSRLRGVLIYHPIVTTRDFLCTRSNAEDLGNAQQVLCRTHKP
jgi:hypothetical protein